MEENVFPLSRAAEDPDELEEERRLAYVGITRAEKILYLTNANSRLLFGRTNYNRPTRFINEISSDLLEYQGLARPANTSFKASYSSGGLAFRSRYEFGSRLFKTVNAVQHQNYPVKRSSIWSIYSWCKISL